MTRSGLQVAAAVLLAACTSAREPDPDVGTNIADLTVEQCQFFSELSGSHKVTICHRTSGSKPFVKIVTNLASCGGHDRHALDYVAPPNDLNCSGGGCYPEGAPFDGTVPCCEGLEHSSGYCAPAACPANASGSPACACDPGFIGTLEWSFDDALWTGTCNDVDECATDNGGCGDLAPFLCTNTTGGFTCGCNPGYEGLGCVNIDDCAGSPCQNGGMCVDGVAEYSCVCAAGYEGNDCETNIDDCAVDPCELGATCIDGVASYSCDCGDVDDANVCTFDSCDSATGVQSHADIADGPVTGCADGQECRSGVCENTCLAPESDAEFCARNGKVCGGVTAADNCGQVRTVASCGCCAVNNACSPAGACEASPGTTPGACAPPAHPCTAVGDHYVAIPIHSPPSGTQIGTQVAINNANEVVWSQGGTDLYSNVRDLTSMTFPNALDTSPVLNDAGDLAWQSTLGTNGAGGGGTPNSWDIVKNGVQFTGNPLYFDGVPRLMSSGEVVWLQATAFNSSASRIVSSVRGTLVTTNASTLDVNDLGDIVYRTNVGTASIIVRRNADGSFITVGAGDHARINNAGQVVWQDFVANTLRLSTGGAPGVALGTGQFPDLNNLGQVTFSRSPNVVVRRGGSEFVVVPTLNVNAFGFPVANDAGVIAFGGIQDLGIASSPRYYQHVFMGWCAPASR